MLGLCTVGVLLILVFELSNSAQQTNVYSAILGLLSGVLYAGVVLSLRWLRDEDSAWLVVLNFTMTAAVMAPLVLVSARPARNDLVGVDRLWNVSNGIALFAVRSRSSTNSRTYRFAFDAPRTDIASSLDLCRLGEFS